MGFVEHHQIPRLGVLQQHLRPIAAAQQMTGRDHDRFAVPLPRVDLALMPPAQRRRGVPDQLAAVVDRPIEIELLAQLDLPLAEHRLGSQDQNPPRPPRQPRLPQQHSRLDRLAQSDLIGDQEFRRPLGVEALERPHLMRPRRHRRRRFADAGAARAQTGRLPDEGPYQAPPIDDRRNHLLRDDRGLLARNGVPLLQARGQIAGGHEAHQVAARRLRDIEHDHPPGATGPEPREVFLFAAHPLRLRSPARVDVDALPVVLPAGRSLVQAAVPGDPVAGAVLNDARLLVEDSVTGDRRAVDGARDRHLHGEMTAGDHPGEQFEGAGGTGIGGRKRHTGQASFDQIAQPLALFDCRDLGWIEGTPDHQPHVAAVAHQAFDAARRQGQRAGAEIAGQPVVALGILQRRHIEQPDEVTVVGGVLELPGAVGEHPQAPSSCHNLNCWGSSIRSRYARRYRL